MINKNEGINLEEYNNNENLVKKLVTNINTLNFMAKNRKIIKLLVK